jgi:hypothetical protein
MNIAINARATIRYFGYLYIETFVHTQRLHVSLQKAILTSSL